MAKHELPAECLTTPGSRGPIWDFLGCAFSHRSSETKIIGSSIYRIFWSFRGLNFTHVVWNSGRSSKIQTPAAQEHVSLLALASNRGQLCYSLQAKNKNIWPVTWMAVNQETCINSNVAPLDHSEHLLLCHFLFLTTSAPKPYWMTLPRCVGGIIGFTVIFFISAISVKILVRLS